MPKKLTVNEVDFSLSAVGLERVGLYVDARTPLLSICLTCNRFVNPTVCHIRGNRGGCGYCSRSAQHFAQRRDVAAKKLAAGNQKFCRSCQTTFSLDRFGERIAGSGNIVSASYCRECNAKKAREYYDPIQAQKKYQKDKLENPEKIIRARESSAQSRLRKGPPPPERIREWRANNRDYVLAYASRYKKEHRQFATMLERARQAKKRNLTVVKITQKQLNDRMSMFPGCWMCGGAKENIDHVKPLSKGGAHMLCNLRPACQKCNLRKSDKWPLVLATKSYPLLKLS